MDLTPHARRIVELAREQRTPSEQDLARIEERIALGLGATAATAVVVAQTANVGLGGKAAAAIAAHKWVAGAALIVTAVAGYAVRPAPAAEHAPAPRSTVTARSMPLSQVEAPAPALPVAEARAVESKAEPLAPRPRAHVGARRQRTTAGTQADDVELLHRAQAAWRARDASTALALLREHRARFARSGLRLERDALQVLALCAVGRKEEAARVARGLLALAPRSPLRVSIEESCALK